MKSFIYSMLIAIVLTVVTGCSSPESRLVGKWVSTTGTLEFFKDKTGIINAPKEQTDLPANVQFKWDFVQKDSVRMIIATGGGKITFAKFDGRKVLIVEDEKFTKLKQ